MHYDVKIGIRRYGLDGSFHEQSRDRSSVSSARKVQEHSEKIRKAVEDRQQKNNMVGDERRNILSELENVK